MPQLEIEVAGHLLVAGVRAQALGVDLATAKRWHEGRWVPYVPATALRGAVRMQLEALLKGADLPSTGPYPFGDDEETAREAELDDPVARLFGHSGPDGSRTHAKEGQLRFSDALPVDAEHAAACFAVRPGVELDDARGTAADRKLFFREVAEISDRPLIFHAQLDTGKATEEDLQKLKAAVATTDALGAGKASGGGEVRIRWTEGEELPGATVRGDVETATRARLTLTLREPAHFGDGGPLGFHHATRTFIPGSTLRGAIAWALIRRFGKKEPETQGFRALFLNEDQRVGFGDGLCVSSSQNEPQVRPATTRRSRGTGELEDLLVSELARDRVNRALNGTGQGLHLASDDGTTRRDPVPARPGEELLVTTRTRVSLSRHRATAEEQRLFSIEQIEPWTASTPGARPGRSRFVAWVEGLTPEAARELAKIEGSPVLLGAGRNHGLGLVDLEVELLGDPEPGDPMAQVRHLAREIADYTLRRGEGAASDSPSGEEGHVPLALTAVTDFVPTGEEPHPLARCVPEAGEPTRRFLHAGTSGGYDQRPDKGEDGGPLKTLRPTAGAGSVYVYRVAEDGLADLLDRILPELRRGVGGRREAGCGRFTLFERSPESPKEAKDMQAEPSSELKRWMIEEIEKLQFGKTGATSQLRNLVQVAQRETEVPVLANFIRYQAARSATYKFWEPLHQPVIELLQQIERKTADEPELRANVIQHFFGYLVRRYVYWEFQEKGKKKKRKRKGKGKKS